ncbi:MAG: FliO/MopB family protein [Ignavibacteria bacterium]|nr:FliO/MopB family protein [Ignavibacteria bacterium]
MTEVPYQNVIFSIGMVIILLTVILFVSKKLARKGFGKNKDLNLSIVSKIALTPKSYLFVVKASEKTLLIGANDTNVSLISDISNEQKSSNISSMKNYTAKNTDTLIQTTKGTNNVPTSFSAFLQSQFKKQPLS